MMDFLAQVNEHANAGGKFVYPDGKGVTGWVFSPVDIFGGDFADDPAVMQVTNVGSNDFPDSQRWLMYALLHDSANAQKYGHLYGKIVCLTLHKSTLQSLSSWLTATEDGELVNRPSRLNAETGEFEAGSFCILQEKDTNNRFSVMPKQKAVTTESVYDVPEDTLTALKVEWDEKEATKGDDNGNGATEAQTSDAPTNSVF